MDEKQLQARLMGRTVDFSVSERHVGSAILLLRLVMGWVFFQAGVEKLVTYLDADPANNWTAAGYLVNAVPAGNPFTEVWMAMAGTPLIDALNMWGLTLIGAVLLLGLFTRLAAFLGAVMMLLFWASSLHGGLLQGLPLEHGWVVDEHIVYAALLFGLGAFGAGRILGVDAWLEETQRVRNHPWLRYLLG